MKVGLMCGNAFVNLARQGIELHGDNAIWLDRN
jgi:hypothetical protein